MRSISITPAANGFVVSCGCVTLIFTEKELAGELARWITSPDRVEEEYNQRYGSPYPAPPAEIPEPSANRIVGGVNRSR